MPTGSLPGAETNEVAETTFLEMEAAWIETLRGSLHGSRTEMTRQMLVVVAAVSRCPELALDIGGQPFLHWHGLMDRVINPGKYVSPNYKLGGESTVMGQRHPMPTRPIS